MFTSVKIKLIIAAIVLALIVAGFGWGYVERLKYKKAKAELALVQGVVKSQKLVMDQQIKDITIGNKLKEDLNIKWVAAQNEKRDLIKKLDSLDALHNDPKALEDKINKGTKYMIRCNELATGSVVKPEDLENTICPDLVGKKPTVDEKKGLLKRIK